MTPDHPPPENTLLICTVGGTPEPLVQTLLHWRPSAVRFIVSGQTCPQVDTILNSFAEQEGKSLPLGCYDFVDIDDPENFRTIVAALRPLAAVVRNWLGRGRAYEVAVDFTGGTKCMSGALALVARRWRCRFSYVGGHRRSKEGVGVVESGAEHVVLFANPWDALGYQAVEDAVAVFNRGGYAAAAALLDRARTAAADPAVKRELSTLKAVIDGYAAWDRFDHENARKSFDDALKNRNDLAAIFPHDGSSLIDRIDRHCKHVARLAAQEKPDASWVEDLLRNAERRAAELRFDDAVARLYRAFEALAQVRLRERHGLDDTKGVSLEALPDALRAEWRGRAKDGRVLLGLRDAYRLLRHLDDALGADFAKAGLDDDKRSPLVARNQSILAHGFQSVRNGTYGKLHDELRKLAPSESGGEDEWRLPELG